MQREICFRGKSIEKGEWMIGNLLYLATGNYIQLFHSELRVKVIPESVGQFSGLKGFENDIAEVCIFLVSPSNPDNDQHFRGVIDFKNGKFVFVIHKYLKFDGSKSEWVNISTRYLPFYDEEIDEDGTYTVDYYDFLAMSSNLGEFNDDVEIVGNIFDNPDLIT